MPHTPSGGGSIVPLTSPCPSPRMSIKDLRSRASATARRKSALSKGGAMAVEEQLGADISRSQLAARLRRLTFDVLQEWHRHLVGEGHVELAGDEREDRRRPVRDDSIFDTVEIRSPRFPVVGISRQPDRLVWLEFNKFERPCPDRTAAHVTPFTRPARRRCASRSRR